MKNKCEWKDGKPIIPICVDFESTVCYRNYPEIGKENEHCIEVMKKWSDKYNVGWILNTMRDNETLDNAVKWLEERGITLYGINVNPTQKLWTTSPKAYAKFYIDDKALGTPLIYEDGIKPRVDWKKIDENYSPMIENLYNSYQKNNNEYKKI